jgi:hypothetical protein
MPVWLLALLPKAIDLILGLFGGPKKDPAVDVARELGRAEQQNATMKGDMATVRAATEAAKRTEQEPVDADPNDRDNARR